MNFGEKAVHFRCSISNVHNFGRNRHFLILEKANESSLALVSFSLLVVINIKDQNYVILYNNCNICAVKGMPLLTYVIHNY